MSPRPGDLVERYRRGEHDAVWAEVRAYQAIQGALRDEVMALAVETMGRVRPCADVVAERLQCKGWVALNGVLRSSPGPNDPVTIREMEDVVGAPLPPSLHAFWAVVGGIDFVWDYNAEQDVPDLGVDLDIEDLDPLCVDSVAVATYLLEEWRDQKAPRDRDAAEPFALDLSPDRLHKANVSGGPPYHIDLPFDGADPVFVDGTHSLPFVDYLRLSFRWGGFPGLSKHANAPGVHALVKDLTRDLEPF